MTDEELLELARKVGGELEGISTPTTPLKLESDLWRMGHNISAHNISGGLQIRGGTLRGNGSFPDVLDDTGATVETREALRLANHVVRVLERRANKSTPAKGIGYGQDNYGEGPFGGTLPEGTDSAGPVIYEEQQETDGTHSDGPSAGTAPSFTVSSAEGSNVIRPAQWVRPERTPALQDEIDDLDAALKDLLRSNGFRNLPPDEIGLTEAQRARIIDLLETALAMFKGPLVEKSLLNELSDALRSGAIKAAEKGAENGFTFIAGAVAGKLGTFLGII